MRQFIAIGLLLLTMSAPLAQTRFAAGMPLLGPVYTYSISASGEIVRIGQTPDANWGEEFILDGASRFIVTRGYPHDIDLYQVEASRQLSPVSFYEAGPGIDATTALAMSQDGLMLLARFRDGNVDPPLRYFATLVVNNRLQLRPTGFTFTQTISGLFNFALSDQGSYTAILNQQPSRQFTIMHISASGEMTLTGQIVPTTQILARPFDFTPDGRWGLSGHNNPAGVALLEVQSSGEVAMHDFFSDPGVIEVWSSEFFPDLSAIAIAGDSGPTTIGLNANREFGNIIDEETLSSGSNTVAVSHDGQMLLADGQAPGFVFPIYSYSLSPDGQMTSTGHGLPRSDFQADLRFIPDPTPVTLPGDANLDGLVDSADVTFLINEAMPDDKPILFPPNFANADLDQDVDVDAADLESLVQMLLGSQ